MATKRTLGQRVAPARFLAFLVIFAVAFAASFAALGWSRALMTGFDVAAVFFLLAITPILRTSGKATMRQHAEENDANRVVLLILTSVTMIAILTAVFSELSVKDGGGPPKGLIVGTLALAWLFSNTIYALHYAHVFYVEGSKGGLKFSGTGDPDYSDFVYFAFTLGMTFQTSDTAVETRHMRRIVTVHSLLAFVFNIGVLAFTINVLGGG
ncbi:DUF1345 domain-containing protein [Sphingomonas sp. SUN039]|uniref:DUF1345 domain-containing protein n=1 Tax=Sphingomonas sp. SUN039 TaxID=2937787 RepID=UPI002164675E|nr:DUF1345 domain-containing protein [Sphingomonas sp. SUN039]UVO55571.1 DUF1345 domain-containing protein [Sphingomonas sp. SUN039]